MSGNGGERGWDTLVDFAIAASAYAIYGLGSLDGYLCP